MPSSSGIRRNRALFSLTAVALGFGLSSATPAHAYSFVTSQAAFDAATTSQTLFSYTGAGDVTVGNPVVGNVGSSNWDVSSTYAGNLEVTNSPGQIRGIYAAAGSAFVPVNDFTISGATSSVKTGALFFSLEGTIPSGGTASVYVNGSFAENYTFTDANNTYLGIIGANINSVSVVGNSGEQLHVVKDLQVGSPVPEFSSLLGLGGLLAVGGFAGLRRRKVLG